MISWHSHWGWPKPIADIFLEAKAALGDDDHRLLYGPGHVVWEEECFEHAQWSLDHFDDVDFHMSNEEKIIIRQALERTAALPREAWDVEPKDYDGECPADYPPPLYVAMVRVQ